MNMKAALNMNCKRGKYDLTPACQKANSAVLTEDVNVDPVVSEITCRREAHQGRTLLTLTKVRLSSC